ncbi:LOW QUALITY PROTEIN: DNA polymerase iota-like [Guaruba guarouba]
MAAAAGCSRPGVWAARASGGTLARRLLPRPNAGIVVSSLDLIQHKTGQNKSVLARSAVAVIVHVDLDCFYTQVEMICNPELRDKPLGVHQKYIVITCNYEDRKLGVKKLMSVKNAKGQCLQLVLVNGEYLTLYREMSYKVTGKVLDRLQKYVVLTRSLALNTPVHQYQPGDLMYIKTWNSEPLQEKWK